jgi:hypothetical protein
MRLRISAFFALNSSSVGGALCKLLVDLGDYLDDCFSTIADGEPGQSYADTPIGSHLPSRYEQYCEGRFARLRLVENVHSSSGVRGVGPADRTRKPRS